MDWNFEMGDGINRQKSEKMYKRNEGSISYRIAIPDKVDAIRRDDRSPRSE